MGLLARVARLRAQLACWRRSSPGSGSRAARCPHAGSSLPLQRKLLVAPRSFGRPRRRHHRRRRPRREGPRAAPRASPAHTCVGRGAHGARRHRHRSAAVVGAHRPHPPPRSWPARATPRSGRARELPARGRCARERACECSSTSPSPALPRHRAAVSPPPPPSTSCAARSKFASQAEAARSLPLSGSTASGKAISTALKLRQRDTDPTSRP